MTKTITGGFSYRVSFAASVISRRGEPTRNFDNCFEMHDGDAVVCALYRRSRRNPKLRANLWRYLSRASVVSTAWANRRRKTRDLAAFSAELIRQGEADFAATMARLEAQKAAKQSQQVQP